MEVEEWVHWISEVGYMALFFCLWLGIIGMPVPDETVVMTGGLVSSMGLLAPVPSFLVTYMGVVSGLSLGYVVGRWASPLLHRLVRKGKRKQLLKRSEEIIRKYGGVGLSFSYFIPGVRHVAPYLAGCGRMPFRLYALYSYGTGLVWTGVFFFLGRVAGQAGNLVSLSDLNGFLVGGAALLIVGLWMIWRIGSLRMRRLPEESDWM
ncbi:membrane protein DedA with SNARE-associated domain [Kroppenstedtia sanguinis]|uniref:DedA family protein n=1 Tax=Kroppenstedtia sanguinis TaxID=1380684 RepID=UPI003D1D29F8